jgi:hypothetical protein
MRQGTVQKGFKIRQIFLNFFRNSKNGRTKPVSDKKKMQIRLNSICILSRFDKTNGGKNISMTETGALIGIDFRNQPVFHYKPDSTITSILNMFVDTAGGQCPSRHSIDAVGNVAVFHVFSVDSDGFVIIRVVCVFPQREYLPWAEKGEIRKIVNVSDGDILFFSFHGKSLLFSAVNHMPGGNTKNRTSILLRGCPV